ncbi:hypothetical protein DAEQUDRAFT_96988 [Daedalea quercina L-15889]|uniref:Secreted protein n=1 Tax=Daedalea quercina L-15889 TaxID=1314783 RepID=A0A165SC25_9APHY|nr:hypothetical protein DAEQUDRAFT_96988 [Daedalea quercina L-15889]
MVRATRAAGLRCLLWFLLCQKTSLCRREAHCLVRVQRDNNCAYSSFTTGFHALETVTSWGSQHFAKLWFAARL